VLGQIAALGPDSYAFVPIKVSSPDYWARVMFDVEINGHSIRAMLGTDYADTRLTEEGARDIGVDLEAAQPIVADVPSNGGGNGLWIAKLDSFGLGEEVIKPVRMRIGGTGPENHLDGYEWLKKMQEARWDLVLGRDFLRTHRVMVSHSQRRLYYTYLGGPIFGREAAVLP
jgi:hypothetical protein